MGDICSVTAGVSETFVSVSVGDPLVTDAMNVTLSVSMPGAVGAYAAVSEHAVPEASAPLHPFIVEGVSV